MGMTDPLILYIMKENIVLLL